jgi:hypothetical protein
MVVSDLKLKKIIKSKIKISSKAAVKENLALFEFWQKQAKAKAY